MKRSVLFLTCLFAFSTVIPSFADTYKPLVATFHDAYLYYLQKAKEASFVKDQKRVLRYYKLANIYASSQAEIAVVNGLMQGQLSSLEIKEVLSPVDLHRAEVVSTALELEQRKKVPKSVYSPLMVRSVEGGVSIKDVVNKQVLEIPLGKTVMIERKGVKRFSVVDEGFIEAKIIAQQRLQITAVKRGVTFLHFWDDAGRTTIYVKVILLELKEDQLVLKPALAVHNQPFKFIYSNDWSSYYEGPKLSRFHRQNVNFLQSLSMQGPTPYGDVDSNVVVSGFKNSSDVQSYSLGISKVPVSGTDNLNLRFFDAMRSVSPLTLSRAQLRGMFADVDVLQKNLRLSYLHGQVRPAFGFFGFSNSNKINFFVDAGKITLFPENEQTKYALNFASAYGSDRDPAIAKRAFSIEGQQKIDKVTLNAELARNDEERNALSSGLRYDNKEFTSSVNIRDINREYTTVFGPVSSQGEIGAVWSTGFYNERFDAQTVLDMYRNRLYFNPNDPQALNFDLNGRLRMPINSWLSTDAGIFYVDTPGDLSPRRNLGLDDRISVSFDTWGNRQGILYTGAAYQRSRYVNSEKSAFDRLTATVGASLPLTGSVSLHSKYEYSWVEEPFSGNAYNPARFDIGLNYNRSFTTKLSGTWGLNYERQDGVEGSNSFLSGEDSMDGSFGLTYNPVTDMSLFFDSRLRRVWPKSPDITAYYALDIRLGMRMVFGSGVHFDPYGKVYGYVFNDANSNGLREHGEEGIPNVKIKVGDKDVMTDNKGYFEKGYSAKEVVVSPSGETIPAGFIFSTKDSLRVPISPTSGTQANFGVTAHSSVYGIVYVDKNSNAQPDQGDQFIAKIRVVLDGKEEQYTDNRGAYYFRNISVGKHTMIVDLDSLPIEFVPLTKLKNSFEVGQGATYVVHFPMRVKEQQ